MPGIDYSKWDNLDCSSASSLDEKDDFQYDEDLLAMPGIDYSKWDILDCSSASSLGEKDDFQYDEDHLDGKNFDEEPKQQGNRKKKKRVGANDLLNSLQDKTSWWFQVKPDDRYEWFVYCYQLRLDDDYAYDYALGGGDLRGMYACCANHGRPHGMPIAKDFYVFCKMAKENGVLPEGASFDWYQVAKQAVKTLRFAYEKSDAQKRWGDENVSGASLRRTAEQVYGFVCTPFFDLPEKKRAQERMEDLEQEFESALSRKINKKSSVDAMGEVGGVDLWRSLARNCAVDGEIVPRF